MKLVAIAEVRYAQVNLKPGDEFEATESDAMILKAIRKAKDAGKKPVKTKTAKAEPKVPAPMALGGAPDTEASPSLDLGAGRGTAPGERRRYMRRDLQAKE